MKLWKLTDENGRTMEDTQWGPGITHEATGVEIQSLCTNGWIHAYLSSLLAVFMNPAHRDFQNPRLWEAEGDIGKNGGIKVGCRKLTTIKEISLPAVTTEQRIKFAILSVKKVYKDSKWNEWADNWLENKDRTAAVAAAAYAANAAYTAYTADAAAYTADAAAAAYAAYAAAAAANAAAYAAAYAADAANAAAGVAHDANVNFILLAEEAIK